MPSDAYLYSPVKPSKDGTTEHADQIPSPESPVSPRLGDGRDISRQGHLAKFLWKEASWRYLCALGFGVIIVAILYSFSKMGVLSDWDRRWFNTLVILFTSLMSLSLGSLLGLLGSLLRWPLLARKENTPFTVDLLLGMANPTGSFRLIWHHTKDREWSATTTVVLAYLFVNIASRLSVASFGLTYNLNEVAGTIYPIMVKDWGTTGWFNVRRDNLVGTSGDLLGESDETMKRFDMYSTFGLSLVNTTFDHRDPSNYNVEDIDGQGLDRKVEDGTVTYSYRTKEYRGLDEYSSADSVLHCSSTCVGRTLYRRDIYEHGNKVGSLDGLEVDSPGYVQILDGIFDYFPHRFFDYLWAARLDYDHFGDESACATTYLYYEQGLDDVKMRNATYYECNTCLKNQNQQPGLRGSLLRNLQADDSSYAAGLLLRFGVYERVYAFYSIAKEDQDGLGIRVYSASENTFHSMNGLSESEHDTETEDRRMNVSSEAELYAAHLAARLPILSIMGADHRLPKVTKERGALETPYVDTKLEVKWLRTIGVLVGLLVAELIIVAIMWFACRKVLVRDHDSYLSIARLLRTAVSKGPGGSVDDGKELAKSLGDKGYKMLYGTTQKNDGQLYHEVDLWTDVGKFPDGLYK